MFPVAETGFDPAAIHDLYSAGIVRAIFETLYTYDYLARPAKIVPQTADGMPQVTEDGKVYTVKLTKGIYFQSDPAFGGKKRELTADDVVYSFKRVMDPKIRSPYTFLLEGKIVGLDAVADAAKKSGKFDYDKKIPGLEAVDRYTVRFRMTDTDYNLPYVMAHEALALVAREVIEKYGESDGRVMSNPVGTGPYKLGAMDSQQQDRARRQSRTIAASCGTSSRQQPGDDKLVAKMKGKTMPQVGRVEVYVMVEDQTRWLAFQKGELDFMNMEGPLAPNAIARTASSARARGQGRAPRPLHRPRDRYMYWNMLDPRVGGLGKEQIALRRALAMAYDASEEVRVVLNGQAVEARVSDSAGRRRARAQLEEHDQVRSRGRQRAARQVRLQARRRRLSHVPRRQADGDQVRRAARHAKPPARGARQEELRRDRRAHGEPARQVPRAPEAREAVQALQPRGGVDRRLSGRRQLHAALVRPQRVPEQQRVREDPGVRRAVQEDDAHAAAARSATSCTRR